jgi:hypothetical protein
VTFLFQSAKPQIPEFAPWYAGWRKKCDRIVCFAGWWRPEIRIEKVGDLEPDSAAISLVAMRANGPTDQRVRSAAERIIAAARKVRKPVCILVGNAKEAADWLLLARIASLWHPTKDSCGKQPHELGLSFPNSLARNVAIWQVGTAAEIPSNYELHPKA